MPKGTLTVRIIGDARSLGRTLDSTQRRVRDFGSGVLRAGRKIALFGGAAAAGMAVAGRSVLDLGGQIEAMDAKAAQVFGSQTGRVERWAKQNARSMGLASTELKGLAANFGDLLVPMGFTRKAAADMSTDVVGLAGALSEWSGGQRSAADVAQILAKAMLGERESLKELGISIMDADVQQRLLEKGQKDLKGAALQQAKAIATQELIFEKSRDAQEAYRKGTFKTIRMQNEAKAAFKEFREKAVRALLPVVLKAATFLREHLPRAIAFVQKVVERFGPAVVDVFKRVVGFVRGFVDGVRGFIDRFRQQWDGASGKVSEFGARAREILSSVQSVFKSGFDAVRAIVQTVVKIISGLWQRFGKQLVKHLQTAATALMQIIGGALKVIQGVFDVFAGIFTGKWGRVWDGIKKIFAGVWEAFKGIARTVLNAISTLIGAAMAGISAAWSLAWRGIKNVFAAAFNGIKEALLGGVRFIVDKWLAAVEWIIRGAAAAFGWVPGIGPKLKRAAKQFEKFRDDVNRALGGIKDRNVTVKAALDLQSQGLSLAAKGERAAFHHGGIVQGTPSDQNVPAFLRPGERVISSGSAAAAAAAPNVNVTISRLQVQGEVRDVDQLASRLASRIARLLGEHGALLGRTG